ncbi:type IV secretory system conjugative DNA transfer family protein [Sphingobium sp. AN641]|uniref:type IV secretory system conjugative DNA transfer family protein n=1 Tax=Sphingobium sp. AN641 TaxID=3133443 RepID=UPI0030BE5EAF
MTLPKFSKPLNNAQTVLTLGLCAIILFKLTQGRFVAASTLSQVVTIAIATAAGYALGWFLSPQAKAFRAAIKIALGLWLGSTLRNFFNHKPTTFGSAEWATLPYLQEHGLIGSSGIRLGGFAANDDVHPIHYTGDRHLLTIAPTRSGKGTTAIIPNLLTFGDGKSGSVLVLDPKGEDALITASQRIAMGQEVHIVDPWDIASGGRSSRFNPLDWLDPTDPDITENAMILADALVFQYNEKDMFWTEEAKALLQGYILYVATDPREADHRHLPRVRDLLLLDGDEMKLLWQRMLDSEHHIVVSTGARCLQKEERVLANVIASAQAQTNFLDSSRLRHSLAASDFKFEDMKAKAMSIYLVLPADRLNAFGRWLRLLIAQSITVNARNIAIKPAKPILFVLDELPALGKLASVETAFSLMAGFGMQMFAIAQDLGKLKQIYGEGGYESLISNSGCILYYGSRDKMTAEYFSSLCGVTTVWNLSSAVARAFSTSTGPNGGSSSNSTTSTDTSAASQRNLAYADELMRLKPNQQLAFIDAYNPIIGVKQPWFADPELSAKGVNLHRK